ncbi:hypothetical protein HAX54_041514 [Datura stramonium]|uniref:Uncharacterized protein n=1 Tax=Datura stramonium TaxID=4076 RepID=A0ABS8RHK9_DATST|nr:hypothetical protein [Datura stramonium]
MSGGPSLIDDPSVSPSGVDCSLDTRDGEGGSDGPSLLTITFLVISVGLWLSMIEEVMERHLGDDPSLLTITCLFNSLTYWISIMEEVMEVNGNEDISSLAGEFEPLRENEGLTTTGKRHLKGIIAEEVRIIDSELSEYPEIEKGIQVCGVPVYISMDTINRMLYGLEFRPLDRNMEFDYCHDSSVGLELRHVS